MGSFKKNTGSQIITTMNFKKNMNSKDITQDCLFILDGEQSFLILGMNASSADMIAHYKNNIDSNKIINKGDGDWERSGNSLFITQKKNVGYHWIFRS